MKKVLENEPKNICNDILKQIGNEAVNVELDSSGKTSLYVFLNNTIYISTKESKLEKDKKNKSKLLVIAHECAHSIQSRTIQFVNFILANIEIVLFFIILFVNLIIKYENISFIYTYISIFTVSVAFRLFLEMNATINSVKIVIRYLLNKGIEKGQVLNLINYYKIELLKSLPFYIFSLFTFKIIRLVVILLLHI